MHLINLCTTLQDIINERENPQSKVKNIGLEIEGASENETDWITNTLNQSFEDDTDPFQKGDKPIKFRDIGQYKHTTGINRDWMVTTDPSAGLDMDMDSLYEDPWTSWQQYFDEKGIVRDVLRVLHGDYYNDTISNNEEMIRDSLESYEEEFGKFIEGWLDHNAPKVKDGFVYIDDNGDTEDMTYDEVVDAFVQNKSGEINWKGDGPLVGVTYDDLENMFVEEHAETMMQDEDIAEFLGYFVFDNQNNNYMDVSWVERSGGNITIDDSLYYKDLNQHSLMRLMVSLAIDNLQFPDDMIETISGGEYTGDEYAPNGIEIVTPRIAATPSNIDKLTDIVSSAFSSAGLVAHKKAGLHVHVGVTDDVKDIHLLRLLFIVGRDYKDEYEEYAGRLYDEGDYSHDFSNAMANIESRIEGIFASDNKTSIARQMTQIGHAIRGLHPKNALSMKQNSTGTVEFRLGSSTVSEDAELLKNFLVWMLERYEEALSDDYLYVDPPNTESVSEDVGVNKAGAKYRIAQDGSNFIMQNETAKDKWQTISVYVQRDEEDEKIINRKTDKTSKSKKLTNVSFRELIQSILMNQTTVDDAVDQRGEWNGKPFYFKDDDEYDLVEVFTHPLDNAKIEQHLFGVDARRARDVTPTKVDMGDSVYVGTSLEHREISGETFDVSVEEIISEIMRRIKRHGGRGARRERQASRRKGLASLEQFEDEIDNQGGFAAVEEKVIDAIRAEGIDKDWEIKQHPTYKAFRDGKQFVATHGKVGDPRPLLQWMRSQHKAPTKQNIQRQQALESLIEAITEDFGDGAGLEYAVRHIF